MKPNNPKNLKAWAKVIAGFLCLIGVACLVARPVATASSNYTVLGNTVYITTDISEPNDYEGLVQMLDTCRDRALTIELTTPGGDVDTMYMLADAISNSPCETTVHVRGIAASAGAVIALAATHTELADGALLMFHDLQVRLEGPRQQQQDRAEIFGRQFREYLTAHNKGILTEDDINQLMNGKEIFLTKSDFDKRVLNEKTKTSQATGVNTNGL